MTINGRHYLPRKAGEPNPKTADKHPRRTRTRGNEACGHASEAFPVCSLIGGIAAAEATVAHKVPVRPSTTDQYPPFSRALIKRNQSRPVDRAANSVGSPKKQIPPYYDGENYERKTGQAG